MNKQMPGASSLDYRREKYALVAVAAELPRMGYDTVRFSVPPADLGTADLGRLGKAVPDLDLVRAAIDWRYGHSFHYDTPGTIDLVASGQGGLLVAEAKGVGRATSEDRARRPERAWDLVEAVIGRLVLLARKTSGVVVYAAVLPDLPSVEGALRAIRLDNPFVSAERFKAYLVNREGDVRVVDLPPG